MPEYLSPGVYVEEVSTGPKPIEGVSTSVAGFLGPTERGPEDIRYITSWLEFTRWYGGHQGVEASFMSYAVQGFFDNGGKRCYVGRIVKGAASPTTAIAASVKVKGSDTVTFLACGRGEWGNNLLIRILQSSKAAKNIANAKDWVRVQVLYFSGPNPPDPSKIVDPFVPASKEDAGKLRPDIIEDFDDLSLSRSASNSISMAINSGSRLIRVQLGTEPQSLGVVAGTGGAFTPLVNGTGASFGVDVGDYNGDTLPVLLNDKEDLLGRGRGLESMDTVDGVSLLVAPDHVKFGKNLSQLIITSCTNLKDRFAILSTPQSMEASKPALDFDTTFGALYHPWIWVYDPYTRDDQLIPPVGHVTGIIARTDIEQGVFKAPANAVVVGAKDLEKPIPKAVQDLLNPVGVNCIRDFRSDRRGIRLWGARTMSSDPEWRYINVRRLFLYVEESIDEGTQWVVFEPNSEVTWGRVQRSISNFLMTIWRNGGLFGAKPEEAFFVKCDRTTMDEDDIQNGRLICQIGICPVRPAEFVIFRIGQKTADAVA